MKQIGLDVLTAYEVLQSKRIEEVNADAYLLSHKKSGANIVLLATEDNNKVFNIAFRTPAPDNTGVAHIMEHSTLCGSKHFPLKDPFVELVKGSLNTFLNAMTYPDKTMYPVASCNDQDFQNLMHVYMDAVFYPNIYDKWQIFCQEGWTYAMEDVDAPLTINGVVYNEMKGAFSSADDVLEREIFAALFPDTTYANESGGDPDYIPDLTYEQFLDFHRTYYHPANSYIYLYGDMDMVEKLNWLDKTYLSHFERIAVDSEIAWQEPFNAISEKTIAYSIGQNESEKDNTYLSYNVAVGDYKDANQYIAFQVLEHALLNMPGAPLKQALLDAGIGKDIYGEYHYGVKQPYFSIVAKKANPEQKKEFEAIIEKTLAKLVIEGFDKRTLQAGLNTIEFRTREADFGDFPKGLLFCLQVFHSWLYDEKQPFLHLETNPVFEYLKEQIDAGYFEALLSESFLNNQHKSVVIAVPRAGLTTKKDQELEEKLRLKKAAMTKEELEEIVRRTKALKAYQEAPEDEAAISCIPLLALSDIKETPEPFHITEKQVAGVPVVHHNFFTNDIGYLRLAFIIRDLPTELFPYLGIYTGLCGMLDTENYSYQQLDNEINIYTGGMSVNNAVYRNNCNPKEWKLTMEISAKATYENIAYAFALAKEMICNTKYDNKRRLMEIISEGRSRMQSQMTNRGNTTASMRAISYYSEIAAMNERIKGIDFYLFLVDLEEHFEERYGELVEKLHQVERYVFRPENLLISYGATEEGYQLMEPHISAFKEAMHTEPVAACGIHCPVHENKEAFQTSSQVQYVAQAGNYREAGYEYNGSMRVVRLIMSYDYLWNEIRVKGGAYGCGNQYARSGDCYFTSYRDPHLSRTLEVYANVPKYLRNFQADDRDMVKYIIGTISEMDTPLTASSRASRSYSAYMCHITQELLKKERYQVLHTTVKDVQALAPMLEEVLAQQHICVIGNENKIAKEAELFTEVKQVF